LLGDEEGNGCMSKKKADSVDTSKPSGLAERPSPSLKPVSETVGLDAENRDEIAALAYQYWQERGCPIGSDQEDWLRAENELKNRTELRATAAGRR
jgi:hypothetical protein